jgi:hypothetical protein
VSDENASGTPVPPATGGAFDWLRESHQASAPMAPLTDDIPAPAPAPPSFDLPNPAAQPPPPTSFPDLLAAAAPLPVQTTFAPPAPAPLPPPPVAAPDVPPPVPAAAVLAAAVPTGAVPTAAVPTAPVPTAAVPTAPVPTAAPSPQSPAAPPMSAPPAAAAPAAAPPALTQPSLVQNPLTQPPVVQPPVVPPPPAAPATVATPFPLATSVHPAPVLPPVGAPPAPSLTPVPSSSGDAFSFSSEPLAPSTFGSGSGSSNLALERRTSAVQSGNGPLDWVAFILAFLAPPIGLLLGIGAVVSGSRTKGYATSIAKAAIGIGAGLSLVLGVVFVVVTKIDNDQAAHAAIVASSASWCAKVTSNPATLTSDTFGWPAPGDTIPKSIAAIKAYESTWEGIAKLAPPGIRADSQKVADTAKSIAATVQSTQTLNDAGNVAQMQNVVATSGIHSWVSNYCN